MSSEGVGLALFGGIVLGDVQEQVLSLLAVGA
jgi:hypothetical protein